MRECNIQPAEKRCPSCEQVLPVDKFPKNRSRKDGLHAYCLACNRKKQARDRRQPWHREMRHRYRHETPNGAAAYQRYYDNNQHKKAAQTELQNAVARGDIVKPARCTMCMEERPVEGHHEDYNFPFAVIWLCRWCHREWHRKHGPARSEMHSPR